MADYTDKDLLVRTGMVDVVHVSQCEACGALVLDPTLHDAFHEGISQIGAVARAADDTAQMFRPLGGGYREPSLPFAFPDLRDTDKDEP
jgi:hypothetical protein